MMSPSRALPALAALLLASAVAAQPTHVMIRARSLDAKFIGAHTGGVKVTLTDSATGRVLSRGLITGGTGDTPRIMKAPLTRGAPLADAETAGFDAVVDIDAPTLVRAEAWGPAGKPAAAIRVVSELWVLPGRDVGGDGWILSCPGLVVEPTAAPGPDGVLKIGSKVTMMCGCPIEPGGIWDAATFSVRAELLRRRKPIAQSALAYAGQTSQFASTLAGVAPGRYTLRVTAAETGTPNVGVATLPVTVTRQR